MINLDDYLKQNVNDSREINNTKTFYDKFEKLNSIYNDIAVSDKLLRSQGKYNSKICFIFKDKEHYNLCMKSLHRILPIYGIDMWDILTLFSDKTENNADNISILFKEIQVVNPLVIYIFDNDGLNEMIINEAQNKTVLCCKMINVDNIDKVLEKNISTEIFDLFEYLITYNY